MKLPGLQRAQISRHKVKYYLLDKNHPAGGPKASFFIANGFSPKSPEKLEKALLAHAREHPALADKDIGYGMKYIIEGGLLTPEGRTIEVVAIWQIMKGEDFPRLVTAYPA